VAVGIRLQVPGLSPELGAPAAPSATPLAGDALFSVIPAGKRASARPDIVLISVDTLRADVLGAYGDTRGLTPFLDQLAAKGTVFERAYASSSWTVPTVATMVTGLYAHQHGVDRGAFRNEDVHSQAPLPADFVVLAERLKGVGYRTLGVTTNAHLGGELGYLQGFDSYVNAGFEDAAFIDATVRDWAPMIAKGDQPVFRFDRSPAAALGAHQRPHRPKAPVRPGRAGGQDPQGPVLRGFGLDQGRAAYHRGLDQGIKPGEGLVQGDVLLHLTGRQIRQGQPCAVIVAHRNLRNRVGDQCGGGGYPGGLMTLRATPNAA
jgi:hypothetical protein